MGYILTLIAGVIIGAAGLVSWGWVAVLLSTLVIGRVAWVMLAEWIEEHDEEKKQINLDKFINKACDEGYDVSYSECGNGIGGISISKRKYEPLTKLDSKE